MSIVSRRRSFVRASLGINFFLALLFVVPAAHHFVDAILRDLETIGWGASAALIPLWVVVSTLLATVLLICEAVEYRKRQDSMSPLAMDCSFLLAWWVTLVGFLAYGYGLGMGG